MFWDSKCCAACGLLDPILLKELICDRHHAVYNCEPVIVAHHAPPQPHIDIDINWTPQWIKEIIHMSPHHRTSVQDSGRLNKLCGIQTMIVHRCVKKWLGSNLIAGLWCHFAPQGAYWIPSSSHLKVPIRDRHHAVYNCEPVIVAHPQLPTNALSWKCVPFVQHGRRKST